MLVTKQNSLVIAAVVYLYHVIHREKQVVFNDNKRLVSDRISMNVLDRFRYFTQAFCHRLGEGFSDIQLNSYKGFKRPILSKNILSTHKYTVILKT